ncbi:MAG: hypothetical protein IPO94_16015 [Saprospiraceae bacterium]|nr:hypothetical protein [Saprospiraceae bacterium]
MNIYGNLKHPKSRELEVHGKALAQFVISKDGSVINIKVLNGVDSGYQDVKDINFRKNAEMDS